MILGANTWKPNSAGNIQIKVKIKPTPSNGNETIPETNGVQQTDIIPMPPIVDPKVVGTVNADIAEK